ncbi:hypothetical protein P5V15_015309 [Pogonomyrmex californicus]
MNAVRKNITTDRATFGKRERSAPKTGRDTGGSSVRHASSKHDNRREKDKSTEHKRCNIASLNPREFNQAPTTTLSINGLMLNVKFMIDTGAAPNLIKERNVLANTSISRDDILYLSGITQEKIATLGSMHLNFLGYKIKMHAVPNNFSIVQEGILGSDFLCDNATIDFPKKVLS